jgi:hypothetical protein
MTHGLVNWFFPSYLRENNINYLPFSFIIFCKSIGMILEIYVMTFVLYQTVETNQYRILSGDLHNLESEGQIMMLFPVLISIPINCMRPCDDVYFL